METLKPGTLEALRAASLRHSGLHDRLALVDNGVMPLPEALALAAADLVAHVDRLNHRIMRLLGGAAPEDLLK